MVNTFRLRAKRTIGSTPPEGLLFGELAYSDANEQLYVGRADVNAPPATFGGNPTDYGPAIAALAASDMAQDAAIAALAPVATSGAYADLSGKPSIPYGFTYDQQAEPATPMAGQTWRERNASGQIVGDWEWIAAAALWVGLARQLIGINKARSANASTDIFVGAVFSGASRSQLWIDSFNYWFKSEPLRDAANFWQIRLILQAFNSTGAIAANNILVSVEAKTETVEGSINYGLASTLTGTEATRIVSQIIATGAPGAWWANFGLTYRRIR